MSSKLNNTMLLQTDSIKKRSLKSFYKRLAFFFEKVYSEFIGVDFMPDEQVIKACYGIVSRTEKPTTSEARTNVNTYQDIIVTYHFSDDEVERHLYGMISKQCSTKKDVREMTDKVFFIIEKIAHYPKTYRVDWADLPNLSLDCVDFDIISIIENGKAVINEKKLNILIDEKCNIYATERGAKISVVADKVCKQLNVLCEMLNDKKSLFDMFEIDGSGKVFVADVNFNLI